MYACFTYLSEIRFGRHFVAQLVCSDELHGFCGQQCGESFGAYLDYFNLVAVSDRLLITKFDFANVSFTVTANQPAEQQTEGNQRQLLDLQTNARHTTPKRFQNCGEAEDGCGGETVELNDALIRGELYLCDF